MAQPPESAVYTDHSAIVVPPTKTIRAKIGWIDGDVSGQQVNGGVIAPDGRAIDYSRYFVFGKSYKVELPEEPVVKQSGRALFGGHWNQLFGHFILESIGRVWAAQKVSETDPILFIPPTPRQPEKLPDFVEPLIRSFGIKNPLLTVRQPVSYETLVVPQDILSKDGLGAVITEDFSRWMKDVFPARQLRPGPDLYVSRSNMHPAYGRYAGEKVIEERLKEEGYVIFHPQEHSIADQIGAYQRAGRIIFAESSAVHLAALVCDRDQKLVVINRRPMNKALEKKRVEQVRGISLLSVDAVETFRVNR